MKRCPSCSSIYTDDSLQFCLQDGEPLEDAEKGEQETVVRTTVPEAPTVAFAPDHETEMITRASPAIGTEAPSRGGRTVLIVVLTAFVMLVLFGVIGLSGYLYMNRQPTASGGEIDGSEAGNSHESSSDPALPEITPELTPEPTVVVKPTPVATTTSTPDPPDPGPSTTPDRQGISRTVSERVGKWKALAESRSLRPYMDMYADRLDYYRRSGASKAFVALDKRKAFAKYPTIKISVSGLNVIPSSDGATAEAVFDKEWLFENAAARQTGKVRSKLIFRNIDGVWKIISERDIKTYYVNKN